MRPLAVILIAAILAANAQAQTADPKTVVDITGISDGTYLLIIDGGTVTLHPCVVLVPDAPQPPDPPPPDPDLSDRAKAMQAAALTVVEPNRDETAKLLAGLYREVAKAVDAGTFKTEPVIRQAVTQTQTMLLVQQGVKTEWKPVLDLLTEQWTDVFQRQGSDADYAKLLTEAADGLEASTPANLQVDWEVIMQIIKWFIEYILPLIIK